jgi:uncharacterized membrane protein (DUF485 family)
MASDANVPPDPARPRYDDSKGETRDAGVSWEAVAASAKFRALLRAKRRFIIPAVIVFIVYYFALPVLVGYARPLMERRVIGSVNIAYLFALSQFFMAWIIAGLYVRAANRFDGMSRDVLKEFD